jgi:hypothetical protein
MTRIYNIHHRALEQQLQSRAEELDARDAELAIRLEHAK